MSQTISNIQKYEAQMSVTSMRTDFQTVATFFFPVGHLAISDMNESRLDTSDTCIVKLFIHFICGNCSLLL